MGIVGCEGPQSWGTFADELKEYIQDNIQFTIDYVAKIYAEKFMYRPEVGRISCGSIALSAAIKP